MNKWLVSVACAVAVMAMAWRWSLDDRPYDRLASYASLVESFRRIVFEADTGPRGKIRRLGRWTSPIRALYDDRIRPGAIYWTLPGPTRSFDATQDGVNISRPT